MSKKIAPLGLDRMRTCAQISADSPIVDYGWECLRRYYPNVYKSTIFLSVFCIPSTVYLFYAVAVQAELHTTGFFFTLPNKGSLSNSKGLYFSISTGEWFTFDDGVTSWYVNPDKTLAYFSETLTSELLNYSSIKESFNECPLRKFNLRNND